MKRMQRDSETLLRVGFVVAVVALGASLVLPAVGRAQSGTVVDSADYVFVFPDPSGRNGEPDPTVWSRSGQLQPTPVQDVGLNIFDPDNISSLIYFHATSALSANTGSPDFGNTASFRAVSTIQPTANTAGGWEDNFIGWRLILDDGVHRAELALGRDAVSLGRLARVVNAPGAAPLAFAWDDGYENTYELARLANGDMVVTLTNGDTSLPVRVQSQVLPAAQLGPSSGVPGFGWGMADLGGGSVVFHEVHAWVVSPVLHVSIDIKPGSATNTLNLSSAGVVPVAILSTAGFDAIQVDPGTIGMAGASVKMVGKTDRYLCHADDVNGDGLLDLVCQVNTAQFIIEPGESRILLEATTCAGVNIQGQDWVRIVPD